MCNKCQGFMPKEIKILAQPEEEEVEDEYFDFEKEDDDDANED